MPVRNIPTDLLRTLVTVVDLGSHSRAGERLGRSQPTISLQLKRLQNLLDTPLFNKSSDGLRLTEDGETVTAYARRILTLNDDLVLRLSRSELPTRLRIGLPDDYAGRFMPSLMKHFTHEQDNLHLEVASDLSHHLIDGMRDGLYDVVLAMSAHKPAEQPFMSWTEPLTWVCAAGPAAQAVTASRPVRIVGYPQGCVYRQRMIEALHREDTAFELVYACRSFSSIEAAVASGFGLTALARRIVPPGLQGLPADNPLPALDDVQVSLHLGTTASAPEVRAMATRLASLFVDVQPAG